MSVKKNIDNITTAPTVGKISRVPNTFRALRHPNYRLWFGGQTVSLVGSWMQTMAQQVLVYDLTGSAVALGIVNFVYLIPVIPFSFWGGSIADRFDKRKVIIFTQICFSIQALIMWALTATGVVQVWHVYLLSFMFGVIDAIDLPVRQAFTVDMVEGKDDLTNAIGLNSAMFNTARVVGPALAGMVVATTGEANAFLWNSITFAAVIISLFFMRNLPKSSHQLTEKGHAIKHMSEGMHFVLSNRTITVLISLVAVSAFLSMPYNTLMPVFAENILNGSATPVINFFCRSGSGMLTCQSPEALPLGILLAAVGIGAVISALVVASMDESARRGRMLTVGNILFPVVLIFFAWSKSFVFSTLAMVVVGFSFVMQNALANTLLQIVAPDELRGRIMSFYTMTFQVTMRMGGLQAGYVADWLGAPISVGVGAIVSLFYGVFVAFRYPKVRNLK